MTNLLNKVNSSSLLKKGKRLHFLLPVGLIFGLNIVYFGFIRSSVLLGLKANLIDLPLLIILVLFTNYLLENFFPGRKFVPITILILSLVILSIVKVALFDIFDISLLFNQEKYHYSRAFLVVFCWYAVICLIISYVKLQNIKSEERVLQSELEKRKYETEIELLKSQIQPHYFLNTLNNLYYLTLEKSDLAPELVIKFSDLVKYLIFQAKKSKVLILDEINVIQNFLDIEKLRFGDRLKIKFNLEGNIDTKKITPLILLPFIENCFKKSTEGKLGEIHLEIGMTVKKNYLMFRVENNFVSAKTDSFENDFHLNGLSSTKKRLDLLYKDKYDLNIFNNKQTHTVQLKLPVYNDKVLDN